jgi:hypothetical protein
MMKAIQSQPQGSDVACCRFIPRLAAAVAWFSDTPRDVVAVRWVPERVVTFMMVLPRESSRVESEAANASSER